MSLSASTGISLRRVLCLNDSKKEFRDIRLKKWDISFSVFDSITEVKDIWDGSVPNEAFMSSPYLQTLEETNPSHLNNLYLVLKSDNQEVTGVILLQSIVLDFSKSFNYEKYTTNRTIWSKVWQGFRQIAVSWIKFRLLVVGNLYLTGQYGIHIHQYDTQEKYAIVQAILKLLKKEFCGTPYKFSGILYKDFFKKDALQNSRKLGLEAFKIDPNMILPLKPTWSSFDEYLGDMKSKYRVRLKNAQKKFKGVIRRELTDDEVIHYNDEMYGLYEKILSGSGFVLAKGDITYFKTLKEHLGNRYHIIGYFLDDKLVGFYTWILEDDKLDSHFIGLDPTLNNRYQLYLNILLDLVRDGIEQKAQSIYYFRTALEIKSSVGAIPYDMLCYFRHTSSIINSVVPLVFKYFIPQQEWDQRHPFKEPLQD